MVRVRFFGLVRLKLAVEEINIEANTIRQLTEELGKLYGDTITAKEFRDNVMFVNGTMITEMKNMKTKLKDGDEVMILSPASGG